MTVQLLKFQNGNNLLKFLFLFFIALLLHLMLLVFLGLNNEIKNVSGNTTALRVSTTDLADLIKNFETPPELRNDIQKYKSATELTLMRNIKNTLDPRGILNPGKVL